MATTDLSSLTGCVKWFDNGLNYGFITVLSEGQHNNTDVFVHQSNIQTKRDCFRTLYTGECVQFTLAKSDNEKHPFHAVNVVGYNGTLLHCENPNYRPQGGSRGGSSRGGSSRGGSSRGGSSRGGSRDGFYSGAPHQYRPQGTTEQEVQGTLVDVKQSATSTQETTLNVPASEAVVENSVTETATVQTPSRRGRGRGRGKVASS